MKAKPPVKATAGPRIGIVHAIRRLAAQASKLEDDFDRRIAPIEAQLKGMGEELSATLLVVERLQALCERLYVKTRGDGAP